MNTVKTMNAPMSSESGFRLKGWHVLAITIAFFAVIFAVNIGMAYLAVETFSGVQTDKPYESGLAYNKEIAKAESQNARHWTVTENITRDANGLVMLKSIFKDDQSRPITGLDVKTILKAPMDSKRDHGIALTDRGDGLYGGQADVPAGQWDIETIAQSNNEIIYRSLNRVILK